MDGFKKRLSDSIQFKLSLVLSLAILSVAVAAGIVSFVSAFDDAHELQDDVLRQVAALMDRQQLSADFLGNDAFPGEGHEDSRVIVQRLEGSRRPAAGSDAGGALSLPAAMPDGLQTVAIDGETFRVLVRTMRDGGRIAVAQEADFRDEIARDGALRTVMPLLILVPVLLLVVSDLVRKMVRPIATLSREIDRRTEQDLAPMDETHLPMEIRPFAVAINRLLARVAQAMENQRRFVADAAHELRSPLTALSLQAERLAGAEMSDPARARLGALRQGIERGRNLLEQLLTLARVQSSFDPPASLVSVQGIYRRVLEDFMPLAESKRIDIGVEGDQDALLPVGEMDLIALVGNLVDNAIRYTPEGGRVDLSVMTAGNRAVLRVQDTGPGIPLAERKRVFDPFYRSLGNEQVGSGLGLSIVKAIADRIGAEVRLSFADESNQSGLCVTVFVPARGSI